MRASGSSLGVFPKAIGFHLVSDGWGQSFDKMTERVGCLLSVGLSGKLRDDNLNGAVMFENSRHVFGSVSKGNFLIDHVKSVERIIDEIGTDLLEDKSEDARGIIPPALSQAHPICLIPSLILLPFQEFSLCITCNVVLLFFTPFRFCDPGHTCLFIYFLFLLLPCRCFLRRDLSVPQRCTNVAMSVAPSSARCTQEHFFASNSKGDVTLVAVHARAHDRQTHLIARNRSLHLHPQQQLA
jgi:hypothetical protein